MRSCQRVYDPAPNTGSTPADEAVVASGVWTKRFRQVAPRCARSQDPEDTIEDTAVIHAWYAARLVRQHRLDDSPLWVGEFVSA
jgi:hypothetical protein